MEDKEVKQMLAYIADSIEKNPAIVEDSLANGDAVSAVPDIVVALVSDLIDQKPDDIDLQTAITLAIGTYRMVDEILMEAGQNMDEQSKMAIISKTIELLLGSSQKLSDEAMEMGKAAEKDPEATAKLMGQLDSDEEESLLVEEEGVL